MGAEARANVVMPVNKTGCDWGIGDIHGRFDRAMVRLTQAGFDPERDRLFSVGDMIDRHPGSEQTGEWLRKPWFHAILGNHEDSFLSWWHSSGSQRRDIEEGYFSPRNGGGWVRDVAYGVLAELAVALAALPLTISVPLADGRIVVFCHGEFPDGTTWPIAANVDLAMRKSILWGRTRWRERDFHEFKDKHKIPGLSAVVVGHTTVAQPSVLGSMLYLDTGGWIGDARRRFHVLRLTDIADEVERSGHKISVESAPALAPPQ